MPSRVTDTYIRFTLWGLAGNGLVLIGSIFMGGKEAHLVRVLVLAVTVLLSVFLVILSFQSETQEASLNYSTKRREVSRKRSVSGSSPYVRIFISLVLVSLEYLSGLIRALWNTARLVMSSQKKTRLYSDNAPTQIGFFEEVASSTENNQRARYRFRKDSATAQTPMMGKTQFKSNPGASEEKTRVFDFSEKLAFQSPSGEPETVFNPQRRPSHVGDEEKTIIFSNPEQLGNRSQSRIQQEGDSSSKRTEIRHFPNKQLVDDRTRIKFD